ncbi:NADH-quinone oxidoreductase subunit C [Hydrogenibacillus sp. N12]|uniref:NADH-quinone oxidoreductase subunit C n=1 Tax=Hydrogenibacillus sp. N12 TaxID=2866627 RepID=UPI001C7CEEEE|nr:NADH-quinone oxidoreductase subunit C [Hydrogenibacillus sp. N12]QZA33535.1 NADH-quinone oxidoreductase subunit C [Hydrogenibacillus sp. N12]
MSARSVPPIRPYDTASLSELVDRLQDAFGAGVVEEATLPPHQPELPILTVPRERLVDVVRWLKEAPDYGMDFLNDLHAVDRKTHLEVLYVLQSHRTGRMLGLRVKTDRPGGSVPSLVPLYPTADWHEREAYDLFGIRFEGHPNLRRILLPDDWVGHPMLKDYAPYDEGG